MNNNHSSDLKADWRQRISTTLAKDFKSPSGQLFKKGSLLTKAAHVIHDNKLIYFADPSASALFLSQSFKSFEK